MSGMPSAFEMGRLLSENLGKIGTGLDKRRDIGTLDELLGSIGPTISPEDYQNIMENIISRVSNPEMQQRGSQILQGRYNTSQLQAQNDALSNILGADVSGLSEKQKEIFLEKSMSPAKGFAKAEEKKQQLLSGLETIKRMRELQEGGNLGPKIAFVGTGRKYGSTFSKQGMQDRKEYEQLGKSLIPLASLIPIRNQLEFKTLSEDLYNPDLKNEEIKGIVDAMERIIYQALGLNVPQTSAKQPEEEGNVLQTKQSLGSYVSEQNKAPNFTDDQLDAALQQTGGNVDEAMKLLTGQQQ